MLLAIWLMSIQAVWAQSLSKEDIQETCNFKKGTISFTIPQGKIPEGATCTWMVKVKADEKENEKEVTDADGKKVSADSRILTLNLSQEILKIEVSYTDADNNQQTVSLDDVEPKVYGKEYNGENNTKVKFYSEEDFKGKGSKEDPYIISTDLELAKLAHDVTNGKSQTMYSGKYFQLSENINLNKGIWMPIGTLNTTNAGFFGGTLDGDGKTISNMKIYWTTNGSAEASWGLFSRLKGKDENHYATVTNLIIENASLETQKDKLPTGTGTVKIGIVASDLVDYAEVSNIIIRNSRITDHEEKYTAANVCRIGGIIGYLDNQNYRIFNLSSDTEINIHKNATLKRPTSVTVAGAIGCATTWGTNKKNIMPTNIYVHGKKMVTNKKGSTGSVVAFYSLTYLNTYKTKYGATIDTWFYTSKVGTNTYSEGSIKETADFGKDFTDINNNFINTYQLEKKTWTYSSTSKTFSFSSVHLTFKRTTTDELTVMTDAGVESKETYDWYVTDEKGEWKKVNTETSNPFTLPRQDYDQNVYAIGDGARTNAVLVKAIHVNASLATSSNGNIYTVTVTNDTEEKYSNEYLGLDIKYQWYNGDTKLSETSASFKRPSNASYNDKFSCHVTVKSKSEEKTFLDTRVSATTVVYLDPANGNDNNSGYTKDTPMKTWRGAYSKLSKAGSWDENIIVLMGESSKEVTNNTTNGFNITNNNTGGNILTKEKWDNAKKDSPLFRNVTITGEYGNDKYDASIEITSLDIGLPLWGDTRFENITFKNTSTGTDSYKNIFCQYNNLEMGKGIKMEGFQDNAINYGTIDGAVTTPVQIFGGFSNDGRFYPLNDPKNIKAFEESMPHGKEGFSITIKSGFYSAICVGGRQTATGNEYNGVMGTPNLPIKCTITMDIDRTWNDSYNDKNKLKSDYDAGIILAGNHEGAMYADVDIIIRSGKVARIVNGTLGAQRQFKLEYGDKTYYVPMNTFMGRANILLDPENSENNKIEEKNARVVVTELYGGSMGRGHNGEVTINNPFYGYSTITINGGTFKILPDNNAKKENILCGIFGAGAGGMNGIGYGKDDAKTHTPDQSIAYWNDTKDVMLYGPYSVAKSNLVSYRCYNAGDYTYTYVDPLKTNTQIIINDGIFGSNEEDGEIDGIYAGGSGYMSPGLWTSSGAIPSKTGGNVYGSDGETAVVSLTIKDGEFYCKNGIFAGGRGTYWYYSTTPYGGNASDYTALGQTYGNVALKIYGGTFHCPIFGGGYGVADAKLYVPKNTTDTNTITTLLEMARIYGKSNVTIYGGTFYQNIYGGGDMAVVENIKKYANNTIIRKDATNVIIGDKANILGSVFAGGKGRKRRLTTPNATTPVSTDGFALEPEKVGKVIGNTNVTFTGSSQQAPSIYGDIYGGGNYAQVDGSTNVNIFAANFAGQIFGGGMGNIKDESGNELSDETKFTSADISGDTNVNLAQDMGGQEEGDDGKPKDSFSINVIWNKIWDEKKGIIEWTKETSSSFFGKTTEDDKNAVAHFLNPHNIYGGGNLACNVEGTAVIEVLKGMTPIDLLQTQEWKDSYNDNNFPHFSVFGGGYGEHTSVAYTDVTVNVEGDYSAYDAEVDDDDTEQMARPHSRRNAAKTTIPVFDNSKGIPNFTILGVLGGGYAGTVTRSSKVTVDGNTFLHRVYGGGFGDPYKATENTTGQIGNIKYEGSRAEVYVKGGNIYGDVFGGGAGVAPKTAAGTHFTNVARVIGNTIVEISEDAKIYGKVYGGGDMANVGPEDYKQDYSIKPQSYSNINKETGDIDNNNEAPSYDAKNYRTLVNIIGGDIFGSVFGGGKGLRREAAEHYEQVGRINGNTIVHVANTAATSINSIALDYYGNTVPYIWYNIYGGCAYGTVAGNTLVHIEGGMLGRDIFGGGYGDIAISEENQDTQEVLGEKDTNNKATYANILGNTQVQMDGGTWIWNQNADINGNITTWLAAQGNGKKICNSISEFKEMIEDIQKAETKDQLTNTNAKAAIESILNDEDCQQFFSFTSEKLHSGSFKKNNNIYGGGNRACIVGTYNTDTNKVTDGTGEAIVIINHSPLADIIDKNGDPLSMFDITTLPGLCWYISAKNVADPQFSVFGAGYGANTKVAKATVYAQPGSHINDDGIIAVDGAKYRYLNQKKDFKTYSDFEISLYEEFKKVSKEEKKKYYGSVDGGNNDGTDSDPATFRRYRISRLAWTLGVPGFSFQAIHGGGFSGYVTGNTYVETDCQLFCENIYGAGLGAVPFGKYDTGEGYDFGKVGGKSKIFIKAGFVGQNVYGGGAGVESVKNKDGQFIDFPDMASVKETEVHIYGRKLKLKDSNNIEIDRTLIIGSVYGGGDVANVGNKNNQTYDANNKDDDTHRTTLVNIRGAGIYSQVFAGGKGRLVTQCGDVTHLGAIYGNTSLLIDRPIITYPYRTETGGYEDPSSDKNMAHPAADINTTMLPLLMEKIYGGCQNGTVYGNTFVTIYDGRIGHGIYGGGLGSCDTLSVDKEEKVVITSADVKGNTNVYIKGGQAMLTSYWLADTRSWEPASIIEGITYSPQYNHQALKFKINHNIYAGGNIACVVGKDAHLTMEKGLLHDNTQVVYGVNVKFFETMVWKEIYNKVGSPHFCVFGGGYGEHTVIKGDTHVNIAMTGRGSKIDPSIDLKKGEEYKHFWSGYSVMDFVGGGYSGKVEGETYVTGDGGAFCRRLFGGGFYNSVKATHVDIYAMDCRDIFGGGMMGDVEKSTTVNIGTQNPSATSSENTFSNKDIFIHGNVYGGNDVSGYVNVVQKNGNFTDNEGTGTHINIYGGKIDGDVYGAGNGDYLYALDRKGNTQITVNENYPLNPNDPNSETTPLVFTVPMRENMPSHKAASDAAKMVNINSWRPMTNKVNINIMGNSNEDYILIKGDVYGGGNSATVLKAQKANAQASEQVNDQTSGQTNDQASSQSGTQTVAQTTETVGSVDIKIGSNVNIRSVFMGCNGEALFTASEDNNFMNKFQKLNGDYYDASKELDFADSIDWENDPSNKGINTLYLPTENAQRPLIYPHLLDLYFQPVEMNIQGTLQWAENLTNCTIGSFYCGGNRGNMNIYPDKKGKVVDYEFPEGLTITSKIVGGCNNANYDYKGEVTHEGGYLLGTAHSEKPFIKLTIKNKFEPAVVEDAYQGGCVYGGCYKTGTVRGDVTIDLRSDMLTGKDLAKLEKSNEYLATNPEYASLNIYGAGYGMESYVYGNTRIVMGDSINCTEPAMNNGKFSASGVSANFIYGGGQQGNVIGLTDVDILNGHVFRSVTGGSYSGYVYGSTQVKVGYPTYYQVNPLQNGKYILKRTDQKNLDLKNNDGTIETPTIKQEIYLLASELISQGVYDDIVAIDNGTRVDITESNKGEYFTQVATKEPSMGWDKVHINIDEAIYGGGYSLAQGTSVLANNTTVLKLTNEFNVDKAFTNSAEHLEELKSLPGETTAGFGGNTLILVGDSKTSEHITISQQDMKEINLPDGTDLYGYYYKHYDDLSKEDYTYRFIYEPVTYFKDKEKPEGLEGCKDNVFYEYDSEGGIFGDGHLSYAQGFRSADITGYGFAGHTIDNPKIINTLQRMDLLRLEDNCFSLLGARDYTVNEINKTPYSIARVGEIKMVAGDGIKLTGENLQVRDAETKKYELYARNFMGLVNNIHYVGAVKSSVSFSDIWYDQEGNISKDKKSYQEVKQDYIDNYKTDQQKFQERNNGTAKNMIGIASGYALKIQNAQEVIDSTTKKMKEKIYYGPIYGVIEINLVYARKNEGGGYVYADNIHENKDFLETTGNFVFPLNESSERYIVDDCSPIGFNAMEGKDPNTTADIHYWYVTGLDYYYNAHITGYTYKEPISFNNDNSDGLTALAGLKAGQTVTIKSWKMRSGHLENYSCDLENNASNKYTLYVGASDEHTYNPSKGFAAKLPMSGTTAEGTYDDKNYIRKELQTGNAKIAFMLADSIDNTQADYYKDHLSKKCQATLVLEADALNDKNQVRTDTNGDPIKYTYTIYLTIEYVQGPTFTGHITIDNCALPGEMIRLKKDQVKIAADQAFAANGYFWHIGKLKRDKDGKLKKDEKGDMQFDEETSWLLKTNSSENTYKQGDKIDDSRKDLFAGSVYDKTRDYLDIPAYYFMNGYGVQLGVTMNGFDNVVFPVNMAANDTLVVHNYHQMDPHKTGVNLHLPEAIQRAKNESYFADPRIYINDVSDLKAFGKFIQEESNDGGADAQFVLQNNLVLPADYTGNNGIFKGIFHGNGYVIQGLDKDKWLFKENLGNIYNLGLESGNITQKGMNDANATKGYHCCFEKEPVSNSPIVYDMNGKKMTYTIEGVVKNYTLDDFKYGRVAYDLNGYYLRALQGNTSPEDKETLKYIYDYYANGDYQYAHRSDAITGNNTGITYLRTSADSDLPNYGQTETRHDKTHKVDEARAIYTEATAEKPATFTGTYRPLLNEKDMNDFLFWGQSLQSTPADYPAKIASQQNKYMINRVYRTDGYYGSTKGKFYYNAYNQDGGKMGTYVHLPATTAINFAASDDNATSFYDFIIKDEVTRNLLVYTEDNTENNATDAYDIVSKALSYDENTAESLIMGHHIVKSGEAYATQKLHLVERTPDGKNSEGDACDNNDFCVPISFSVTNHAWYVRKPLYYAENTTGAWEGICLPFTVQKAEASINGEITHFYGEDNLHHEYWLRGLTEVKAANTVNAANATEKSAIFQRPGAADGDGLFHVANAETQEYEFHNTFFVDTYKAWSYNEEKNSYYNEPHTYSGYLPLTAGIPYVVRFPGVRYYEFDLSSKFYNSLLNKKAEAQTITFHAYGEASDKASKKAIVIPITQNMGTENISGFSHRGTFTAQQVGNGILGMNDNGSAFVSASGSALASTSGSALSHTTVMPFRTYMTPASQQAKVRSTDATKVIRISETTGIDRIEPEANGNDEDTPAGEYLLIRPIGAHRVSIESTYATQLKVFSTTGQLHRILDVQPGTATYSGFPDGIYIFGKSKIMVK